MLSVPHYASVAIAEIKPAWKLSGPTLYAHVSVQQILKFTVLNYITIYYIVMHVVISVMHWGLMVCSANQDQRKVWGPALEEVRFNSPQNQCQQQQTSTSFE